MITTVDEKRGEVVVHDETSERRYSLQSAEGFAAVSRAWLRATWDSKYVYSFTWLGRPIIQLPEDMIRIQEVIWAIRPDIIVETGVAHGGSLIFYASLFELMNSGRVIGVELALRPANRALIEAHPLSHRIELIDGSSTSPSTVAAVAERLGDARCVMVVLDANHTKEHVLAELEAYAPLVTPGSYIVATDGIMRQVAGGPRTGTDWEWNNPLAAIEEFIVRRSDFVLEEPQWPFNEGLTRERVTYWPRAYIKRVS